MRYAPRLPILALVLALPACDSVLEPDPATGFVDVAVGTAHTCALRADGALFCWGDNEWGQLGHDGPAGPDPVRVGAAEDARFVAVDAGWFHTCALRADPDGGIAWCWGQNGAGQLGDGTDIDRFRPVRAHTNARFRTIQTGGAHTCALTYDRQIHCWGRNRDGQLGLGDLLPRAEPARFPGLSVWTDLEAGAAHTCAVDLQDVAWCWGSYYYPYTQFRAHDQQTTPQPLVGGQAWRSVTAGYSHTCGLTRGHAAFCVGFSQDGQVGSGDVGYRLYVDTLHRIVPSGSDPHADERPSWSQLSAGHNHSCGIREGGALFCWGDNAASQLGDGTREDRPRAARILPERRWKVVRAGDVHTCAITTGGGLFCWGGDASGQLGPYAATFD